MIILSRKRLARFITVAVLSFWFSVMAATPALAFTTPRPVQELSSAGAGTGTPILAATGQPVLDASGRPLVVTGTRTDGADLTAQAISTMLRVPLADLFSYSSQVGAQLPPVLSGTLTTITRSDGGIEQVFHMAAPDGSALVFLADRTGDNVYGIRVARVEPSGSTRMFTAHGLNGNFTSPPWYLSAQAKAQYWTQLATAQISALAPTNPPASSGGGQQGGGGAPGTLASAPVRTARAVTALPFRSNLVAGDTRVSLSTIGDVYRRVKR